MARIIYKGKKKGFKVPMPSGEITLQPGQEFEAKGQDLVHINKVMKIEREQAEGMENHSFVLADEYEIAEIEGTAAKIEGVEDGVQEEGEKEEKIESLGDLHIMKLRAICKKAGIDVPNGTKKPEIIKMIKGE